MKENGAFFASITAGVLLAILVGAALTLSYPSAKPVSTTTVVNQSTTTQLTSIVPGPSITTQSTTEASSIVNMTGSTTAVSTTATVASSVTAPCTSPGVECGSFQIVSATLIATPGPDWASNLTLTLDNTGNVAIDGFEVFLNYNVNSSQLLGGVPPGQQVTISITIQSANFLVTSGQTYGVYVEGFIIESNHITANLGASVDVLAAASSPGTTNTTDIGISTLGCIGNCTFNLPWPVYETMGELKDASAFVVVANVTSASVTLVDGIPLTVYRLSVITNIEGPGANQTAGMTTLPMAQIGGTTNGTSVSIEGYPTLSVGSTYVLFLNGPGSLYPAYYDGNLTSVGGPQGTFLVQSGGVFSLDTLYPKTDLWLPIKANDVPLSQFIAEIQSS